MPSNCMTLTMVDKVNMILTCNPLARSKIVYSMRFLN